VVLSVAARGQRVGSVLSIPASARFPEGVLGRIVSARRIAHGDAQLVLTPAAINQAYQQVDVATGGSLDDPGVVIENDQGQVIGQDKDPRALSHVGLHLGGSGVRCTGFNGAPPVDINIDLSPLHWDLSFTYPSPSIHFLVTGSPVITVNLGLNLATECHWTLPIHVVVPIPGTPLQVKISPVLQLSTNGSLAGTFTWSPRLTYGFDRGNGISDEVHVFNPGSATLGFNANASADLFFGPDAELSLGGRVGVSATFGPDFGVSRSIGSAGSCDDADVGLKIEASADVDLFISHWSITLFTGEIGRRNVFHQCSVPVSNGNGGSGSSTNSGGGSHTGGSSTGGSSGSGGGIPGNGGTGGSPVPSGAHAETAGGVAHTWTNYANAGGTQGPSIAANQTVGIACKLPGFKVADGNTWWYRIASSPWNNAYYVSADAFYNNGQTSGSLVGTPFVDPAVANC
jgi:uncharacterized membrane protein YgcG